MQCFRQALLKQHPLVPCRALPLLQFTSDLHTTSMLNKCKEERYSPDSKRILEEYMIPGPFLRFLEKPKRNDLGSSERNHIMDQRIRSSPARPVSYNEFDSSPTIAQERFAHRINRALTTTFATEVMPSKWISTEYLTIRGIKVSRNLRKCHILYTPITNKKKERENVHIALRDWTRALSAMLRNNAQLKYPISVKFVPDTETAKLEDILNKIEAEEDIQKKDA